MGGHRDRTVNQEESVSERMIPILPCQSIDATLAFYQALGFAVTYRQSRPNTYAAIARGDIELQFFVLKALAPEDNFSTCYVLTGAVDDLYQAFTHGLRESLGKLPIRGLPRINPIKDMRYGVRQFIVIDPAGNHIRIGQPISDLPSRSNDSGNGKLDRALALATEIADSKLDVAWAAKLLDQALTSPEPEPALVRFRAFILRADLALRLNDSSAAAGFLAQADEIDVPDHAGASVADDRERMHDIRALLTEG